MFGFIVSALLAGTEAVFGDNQECEFDIEPDGVWDFYTAIGRDPRRSVDLYTVYLTTAPSGAGHICTGVKVERSAFDSGKRFELLKAGH